jgi:hypothetical protein
MAGGVCEVLPFAAFVYRLKRALPGNGAGFVLALEGYKTMYRWLHGGYMVAT